MPEYIFLYGTLRRNYDLKLKNKVSEDWQYVGQGKIGASLYDLGRYPGAVRSGKGAEVVGDVYLLTNAERALKILDKYEGIPANGVGGEFIRKKSKVRLRSGKEVNAWVYWYNFDPANKIKIKNKDYLNYLKNKSTS